MWALTTLDAALRIPTCKQARECAMLGEYATATAYYEGVDELLARCADAVILVAVGTDFYF